MLRLLCSWSMLLPLLVHGSPEVSTSLGRMRGRVLLSRNGREYFAFTGVPYAQPPVGSLRFMPPTPARNWTGILDATGSSPLCFQWDRSTFKGQEDCLYLNINTPKITNGSLPVMVYIHGGGFYMGSTPPAESSKFFMDEDIVLVTMNYRLGRLGFLSLEDETIPGNMGLKDQALALEWVREEIYAFGGNKNLITVFGNSAGSVSAHYICSAPRLAGLVKGCISLSGVGGASSWSLKKRGKSRAAALSLAKALGCSGDQLLPCLQAKSLGEITDRSLITKEDVKPAPVIEPPSEHAIITSWPPENSNFPWITGITADEGILFTGYFEFIQQEYTSNTYMEYFQFHIAELLNLRNKTNDTQIVLNRFITDGSNLISAGRKFGTEAYFLYPALKALSQHSGPKYFYVFNYTGGPSLFEVSQNQDYNVSGVCHNDDYPYFFDMPYKFRPEGWPKAEDVQLSQTLIKAWVTFAREQSPSNGILQWKTFEDKSYLHIHNDGLQLKNYKEYDDIFNFWKDKI